MLIFGFTPLNPCTKRSVSVVKILISFVMLSGKLNCSNNSSNYSFGELFSELFSEESSEDSLVTKCYLKCSTIEPIITSASNIDTIKYYFVLLIVIN